MNASAGGVYGVFAAVKFVMPVIAPMLRLCYRSRAAMSAGMIRDRN